MTSKDTPLKERAIKTIWIVCLCIGSVMLAAGQMEFGEIEKPDLATAMPVQYWPQQPRRDAPEIEEGRAWLDRKAAERERAFQQQQRQQAEERRDLRLERRLEADRRIERDWQGWPGR